MKSDKLQDAIGMIDADLVARANEKPKKSKIRHIKWLAPIAAVLAIVIAVSPLLRNASMPKDPISDNPPIEQTTKKDKPFFENPFILKSYAISQAEYPQMTQYPLTELGYDAWQKDQRIRRQYFGAGENLDNFFKNTFSEFLLNSGKENKLYSPLNVYMALSMLAEVTEGESRQQILDLIGADSIEALRKQANSVWNANYNDDGAVTSILASSLWLNENINFNKNTLKTLADNYYASSYQGKMGSAKFNEAMQEWLNEQTGGLLQEQISNVELDPETIMAIATTIYYQAKWETEFQNSQNTKEIFHSPIGEINCDFMHQSETYGEYYWGEKFSAVGKNLEMSGKMWFILPDEDAAVTDLLNDDEVSSLYLTGKGTSADRIVHIRIPKFDVSSDLELSDTLRGLGITDIFDPALADFSPLTEELSGEIGVNSAKHAVRVAIDEKGCTAAAYTTVILYGAAEPPDEEVEITFDRPFLFVITGTRNTVLFMGIVNDPNGN